MWNIGKEIQSAANRLNIVIEDISIKEAEIIVNKVISKYTREHRDPFLWDSIINAISVHDKDAWQWISKFVGSSEAIMFFNPCDEKKVISFKNGDDIVAILGDTYGYEFYITNRAVEYLLCFNHHDILIACGDAKEWLKEYK